MITGAKDIQTQVAVIGAGAAGIAAASSLAKKGYEVALIEKNEYPGGMATAAYVGTICGLYKRGQSETNQIDVSGFAREFASHLMRVDNSQSISTENGLRFLPYGREAFLSTSQFFLTRHSIAHYYSAKLIDVDVKEEQIRGLTIQVQNERKTIHPQVVIDTTGWAAVGRLCAQVDLIEGDAYQAGAYVFGLDGIESASEFHLKLHLIKAMKQLAIPEVSIGDRSPISIIPGSFKNQRAYFKLSLPFAIQQTEDGLMKAKLESQRTITICLDHLIGTSKAFQSARICMWAPDVGVRTGLRYQGQARLSEQDVLHCVKSDHSAAKGYWPIEYWPPGESVQMTYFAKEDYYDIPDDCLKSKDLENLLFAGRHISADERAIASARVIGTCMQMGESAGRLAIAYLSQ